MELARSGGKSLEVNSTNLTVGEQMQLGRKAEWLAPLLARQWEQTSYSRFNLSIDTW